MTDCHKSRNDSALELAISQQRVAQIESTSGCYTITPTSTQEENDRECALLSGISQMDNTWLRLTIRLPNSLKPFLKNEKNKSEAIVKALESHFGVTAPDDRLSAIESRLTALEEMMGIDDRMSPPAMAEEDKATDKTSPPAMEEVPTADPPANDEMSPPSAKPNRINWGEFLDEFPDKGLADLEELHKTACKRFPENKPNSLKESLRTKLKQRGKQ